MGLLFSERGSLFNLWYWTIVVVLAFAALSVADQTTPTPPAVRENPTPDTPPTLKDSATENIAADFETQRRFDNLRNELRRELLDDRADTINWWLTAVAIFLAVLGIVAVLVGYIGFSRFREIEAEAKKHAEEARQVVEEINKLKRQAEEDSKSITRAAAGNDERQYPSPTDPGGEARDDTPLSVQVQREPDSDAAKKAEEAVQEVRQNPEASPIDRAIADAYSLQRAGRIDEAIEKWRSIANVMEGIDNDFAAHAWLSVGSLLYKRSEEDAGDQ